MSRSTHRPPGHGDRLHRGRGAECRIETPPIIKAARLPCNKASATARVLSMPDLARRDLLQEGRGSHAGIGWQLFPSTQPVRPVGPDRTIAIPSPASRQDSTPLPHANNAKQYGGSTAEAGTCARIPKGRVRCYSCSLSSSGRMAASPSRRREPTILAYA